jgi:cardiolipin synthase
MRPIRPKLLPVVAASLLLLTASCGRPTAVGPAAVRAGEVPETKSFTLSGGNAVSLLMDGPQIFDDLEAMIRRARKSVQVHIFQLGGETGMRVVRALAERKAAGVDVQVLLDPNHGGAGSVKQQFMQCVAALDQAGIRWRDYDLRGMPKGPTWLSRLGLLDHTKLVVVDGEIALMGGMNFYDDGAPNHDYMVRIEGPAATRLGESINLDWVHSGSKDGTIALEPASTRGEATVALAETSPRVRNIRGLLCERFLAARKKIWTEVLFLDDDRVIDALGKARARGVDVKVILDPIKWGNHVPELEMLPFNGIPNWAAVGRLLDAGVQVHWFDSTVPKRNLHAKISMVDDRWVMTGSANYTYRSLDRSREIEMEAESTALAAQFGAQFEQDVASAPRIQSLTRFQRAMAALFDKVKRGIYDERRDLPAPEPDPGASVAPMLGFTIR